MGGGRLRLVTKFHTADAPGEGRRQSSLRNSGRVAASHDVGRGSIVLVAVHVRQSPVLFILNQRDGRPGASPICRAASRMAAQQCVGVRPDSRLPSRNGFPLPFRGSISGVEEAEPPAAARGNEQADDVPDVAAVSMNTPYVRRTDDEQAEADHDENAADDLVPHRAEGKAIRCRWRVAACRPRFVGASVRGNSATRTGRPALAALRLSCHVSVRNRGPDLEPAFQDIQSWSTTDRVKLISYRV